ncbi:MAG TPA: HEAT repeat domain-containing protein [Herpetosiphonaceae bacterium]
MDQLDETTLKTLGADALFDYASARYAAADDDSPVWPAIQQLRDRATQAVFDRSARLSADADLNLRCLGINVIAQIGLPDESFHEQAVPLLLDRLAGEREPLALSAIAVALGHRHDPRAVAPVAALRAHPDPDVRRSVVHAMLAHADPLAIETLILLSADADEDIRDWATFGLGSMIETDTPAIREALAARMDDPHGAVRGEALVGLARRKDSRALPALLADFADGWQGSLLFEAAGLLADPALLPSLQAIKDSWDKPQDWEFAKLEDAIRDCSPPAG